MAAVHYMLYNQAYLDAWILLQAVFSLTLTLVSDLAVYFTWANLLRMDDIENRWAGT